jgi:hypothetical protein
VGLAGSGSAHRYPPRVSTKTENNRLVRFVDNHVSEPIVAVLYGLSAIFVGVCGLVDGRARIALIVVGVVALLLAITSTFIRERLRKRRETADAEDRATLSRRRYQILDKELSPLLQLLAETMATSDPATRKSLAGSLRHSVVSAAASLVGENVTEGTRANLFRLHEEGGVRTMKLEPSCFSGRGDKSRRVFVDGDETMHETMRNQYRFVKSEADTSLMYGTYLTYPVSSTDVRVHGVLTVDCLRPGDLSKEDDVPAMRVLAAIAACAYECEVDPIPGGASD